MRRNQSERDLEKTERDIRRLIEAIKAGVPGAAVTGKKSTIWPEPSTRSAPAWKLLNVSVNLLKRSDSCRTTEP
jgi:hypothetical protein